ncbi:unnamed protein product [Mesocestoides corti]|uniref:Transmembrane protein 45B n=1 Tax=Mesocestoides corti TaxID=53468 RepID=A0A0R3UA57_MESCO|nr:unnamed protein product [Mesocestoides corti]
MGRPENYTYCTIYSSFMLAALVNILAGLRIVLPEGIDFLAHAVAFANLGVLARAQAWGHLHLTVATRLLTSYVAMFAAFALVMELYRPQSHILKFIRTGAVMLQGVWFLQAGLVLDSSFSERWIEEDHTNLMFITIAFSWDMCGVVLFQIFFAAIMEKLCGGSKVEDHRQRLRTTEGARTIKDVNMNGVDEYKPLQTLESLESEVVLDAQ